MTRKTRDGIVFHQMCIHLTCFYASRQEISIFNPYICNFWTPIHSFYCNNYTNIDKNVKSIDLYQLKIKGGNFVTHSYHVNISKIYIICRIFCFWPILSFFSKMIRCCRQKLRWLNWKDNPIDMSYSHKFFTDAQI